MNTLLTTIMFVIFSLVSTTSYAEDIWEHNDQGIIFSGYQSANFPSKLTPYSHTIYRNLVSEDYYRKTEHKGNLYKGDPIVFFVFTTSYCMDKTIRINGVKVSVYSKVSEGKCYIDIKTLKGTDYVLKQLQNSSRIKLELSHSRTVSFSTKNYSKAVRNAGNYVARQNDFDSESDAL